MGKGGRARTKTLLGKLALWLLCIGFYVAGTNYVLFTSVVVGDEKNENLDGMKLVGSKNKKKNENNPIPVERKTMIDNDPPITPGNHHGPSKLFVDRQEAKKAAIVAEAGKKVAEVASGPSKPNQSTTTKKQNDRLPSKPVLDQQLDIKAAIIAEAGKKAAAVAEAASGPSKPNQSTTKKKSDPPPKPNPNPPPTTTKTDKPPPKSQSRDDAIYTCTYKGSKKNQTTVVVPRNAPLFIIIGVQKSGSTALLTHFRDHPQMLQTKLKFRREAHFFDTSWQNGVVKASAAMGMVGANNKNCLALENYMKLFETETIMANSQTMAHYDGTGSNTSGNGDNKEHNNATHHLPLYTFEKTPSYFENPKIPSRVKSTVPWSKIILVLRNPIDRLYSSYKMTVRNNYSLRKYSLEDFVFHELKAMKKYNMTTAPLIVPVNASSNSNSTFDHSVQVIADHYQFPDAVPFDHAVLDPRAWNPKNKAIHKTTDGKDRDLGAHILLRRGIYSTQLKWWLDFYTVGKDLLVINYDDLAGDIQAVYETVCRFTGIPIPYGGNQTPADVGINFAQKVRADDRKNDRPLRNDTRKYLGEFYAPYTAELEDLLGPEWSAEKLEWN